MSHHRKAGAGSLEQVGPIFLLRRRSLQLARDNLIGLLLVG
jgi:hypothetical protein